MAGNGKTAQDAVEFDLTKVTARDMHEFIRAGRESDIPALAETLAKVVTRCPAEWGDPRNPETYINLPYFGEFQQVIKQFSEAGAAQAKN